MKIKRSRTGIALFLAAALSLVLLTACSGGGGGGGGTGGGTPIAPVEFRSTKTYTRAQETENKPFYMEYWLGSNDSGKWVENKDFLLKELDTFMASMQQYRDALAADDQQELVRLLDEGRKRKAEVDGR